jgi:hypothetical protein
MLNIIIGVIAIVLALAGIMRNWYLFFDMLGVIVPLALLLFGIVALLAGIRAFAVSQVNKQERKQGEKQENK